MKYIIVALVLLSACKNTSEQKKVDEPLIDESSQTLTPPQDDFVTVNINDEQGHGPDEGSEEALNSLAYQFIMNDEAYQEDGFGLSIINSEKISEDPVIYEMNYTHRHFGDDGVFYTGKIQIKGNKARFVNGSDQIIEVKDVLEIILRKALKNESSKIKIEQSTKISDLLQTEDQMMSTYNTIQNVFGLENAKMEVLRSKLSSATTFGKWEELLKAL